MANFIRTPKSLSEQRKEKKWTTIQEIIAFYGKKPVEAKEVDKTTLSAGENVIV